MDVVALPLVGTLSLAFLDLPDIPRFLATCRRLWAGREEMTSHVKALTVPSPYHREAAAAYPGLMALRLRGCQTLGDEELEALGRALPAAFPHVRALDLGGGNRLGPGRLALVVRPLWRTGRLQALVLDQNAAAVEQVVGVVLAGALPSPRREKEEEEKVEEEEDGGGGRPAAAAAAAGAASPGTFSPPATSTVTAMRLRSLGLSASLVTMWRVEAAVAVLAAHPALAALEELVLRDDGLHGRLVDALISPSLQETMVTPPPPPPPVPPLPSPAFFASLTHLDLANNCLSGPLPSLEDVAPLLRHLDLSSNHFTGPIPDGWGHGGGGGGGGGLPNLRFLSLASNYLSSPASPLAPFLGSGALALEVLLLDHNQFSGPLAPDDEKEEEDAGWSALANLRELDLSLNALTGPLPRGLRRLTRLERLTLNDNAFQGPIPDEVVASLTRLRRLSLYMAGVSGPLPPSLKRLTRLEYLNLSHNKLTGSLVAALTGLPHLRELHASHNSSLALTADGSDSDSDSGEPASSSSILDLPALRVLWLHACDLEADAGVLLGTRLRLPRLEQLRLQQNRIHGRLPGGGGGGDDDDGACPHPHTQLSFAASLRHLDLSGNRLHGPIPDGFLAQLASLETLALGSNRLSGAIPASVGRLGRLKSLQLSQNALAGRVPVNALAGLRHLAQLHLGFNSLDTTLGRGGGGGGGGKKEEGNDNNDDNDDARAALRRALPGCQVVWW